MASSESSKQSLPPDIQLQPIPAPSIAPTPPFSTFTPLQKRLITFTSSFAAMFSGLSSFIYYPIITPLSTSLSVSIELINLTLTSYLLIAGIAPSIVGDIADRNGRRPIYLVTFAVYFAANVGLALQRSYVALVVLRSVQSLGSSGTITIVYGVIADVATADERGSYVGILMGFTNAAPCLGPIIGGVLSQYAGWPWVFWFLAILSGIFLIGTLLFFPETARKVVGNGSLPAYGLNKTLYAIFRDALLGRSAPGIREQRSQVKFHMPNPINCLRVLGDVNSLLVMMLGSIYYGVFSVLATSLSTILLAEYSLSYVTGGLVYLAGGVGGVIAALCTGRLLDRDYATVDCSLKPPGGEETRAEKLKRFPIETARLRSAWYFMAVNIISMAGYGWSLKARTHLYVPLILQFFTGSTMVAMFTICGTLLTDLNAERSSTAQAAYNLTRCFISAGLVAALQPIADAVGTGWCFCIYAALCTLGAMLAWVLQRYGMKWRTKTNSSQSVSYRNPSGFILEPLSLQSRGLSEIRQSHPYAPR